MTKIIIGESQSLYRAGIVRVLSAEDEFRVVAQCQDCLRLYAAIETFRGAIVIVSSAMSTDFGAILARTGAVDSKLIVLAEDTESVVPYLNDGVSGMIYRSTTSAAFLDCLRRVARGGAFVPPGARTLVEDQVGARACAQLTQVELNIVALLVDGRKNKDIADHLGTTEQVVKNHLRTIFDKTGVSDRLELALFTIHHRVMASAAAEISTTLATRSTARSAHHTYDERRLVSN